jgi:hypothetical protein
LKTRYILYLSVKIFNKNKKWKKEKKMKIVDYKEVKAEAVDFEDVKDGPEFCHEVV